MSHVGHSTLSTRSQLRAQWIVAISALVALVAATAVALVLFVGDSGTTASKSIAKPQAAIRSDGGTNESAVAASVGTQPSPVPDEAAIAASIRRTAGPSQYGPDESTVAGSIGGPRMLPSGPGERAAGASIRRAVPPQYLSDPRATVQSSSGR
jgi:hypothetical protein